MSDDHYADLRAVLAVRGCKAPLHRHEDTIRALLNERDFLVAQRRLPSAQSIEGSGIESSDALPTPSFTELRNAGALA